jgi:cyclophilin family peptidyl-prolyl cis-trans isomerase/protein-disulfide isomerase
MQGTCRRSWPRGRRWPVLGWESGTKATLCRFGVFLALAAALAACGTASATNPSPSPVPTMQIAPTLAPPSPSPSIGPTNTPIAETPSPTLVPLPAPSDEDWTRGPALAPVTFVVYSDYQCPACQLLGPVLRQLYEMHPEEVQVVYRHFPLIPIHDKASLAGQASEAAGAQGRFWEMHDLLFARASEWRDLEPEAFRGWLSDRAEELGLDVGDFDAALDSGEYQEKMEEAFRTGIASGIPGTPFLFMNGDLVRITPNLENLEALTRLLVLSTHQYSEYPADVIDPGRDYQAHIRLTQGEVVVELFPETAPVGVNSFVFLAEQGWYDDSPVFRVAPESRVDMGDPTGTGHGDAGYYFTTEITPDVTFDRAGMVGLSSAGPNISSSQFFVTLAPMPDLNGSRTIIGRVISGLTLLQSLGARDPITDLLEPPESRIVSIEIRAQ